MPKPIPYVPDNYTAKGAEKLRATIAKYWLDRGYPSVRVEKYELWAGTWGIRSNLVAGLPPRRAEAAIHDPCSPRSCPHAQPRRP